jgi:Na+/citrate or Na+/malate symporter
MIRQECIFRRERTEGSQWQKIIKMTPLTLFGLVAVTAMLVTYALESRSTWFILGFAVACILGSAYGFLQGAWPFGVVEAIWSGVAARRWWKARSKFSSPTD